MRTPKETAERREELSNMSYQQLAELILRQEDALNRIPNINSAHTKELENKIAELQTRIELENAERQTRIKDKQRLEELVKQKDKELQEAKDEWEKIYRVLIIISELFGGDVVATNAYVNKLLNGDFVEHIQLRAKVATIVDDIAEARGWNV